jgi:hypothetical protein
VTVSYDNGGTKTKTVSVDSEDICEYYTHLRSSAYALQSPAVANRIQQNLFEEGNIDILSSNNSGGIPSSYYIGDLAEHFLCIICQCVMRDPVQCQNGHSYCRQCVTKYLETRQECPMRCSHETLIPSRLIPNRVAGSMISDLLMKCPSTMKLKSDDMCSWQGKFSALKAHVEVCGYQLVKCLNRGCNVKLHRINIVNHQNFCPFSTTCCCHCSRAIPIEFLALHLLVCQQIPRTCPNNCMTNGVITEIPKKDLEQHLSICSEKKVPCGYHSIGCTVLLQRKDLEAHMSDINAHFSCMMGTIVRQNHIIEQLSKCSNNTIVELVASNLSRNISVTSTESKVLNLKISLGMTQNKNDNLPSLSKPSFNVLVHVQEGFTLAKYNITVMLSVWKNDNLLQPLEYIYSFEYKNTNRIITHKVTALEISSSWLDNMGNLKMSAVINVSVR